MKQEPVPLESPEVGLSRMLRLQPFNPGNLGMQHTVLQCGAIQAAQCGVVKSIECTAILCTVMHRYVIHSLSFV